MSVQYSLVLVRTKCGENKISHMTTELAKDSTAQTTVFLFTGFSVSVLIYCVGIFDLKCSNLAFKSN